MKLVLTFFILLCTLPPLHAGKISGLVTDSTGKPLAFASVFVKNSGLGTNANTEGRYSLSLSPGTYTLVCQYVGYRKSEKTITVTEENSTLDFVLAQQEMMLGEVVLKNGEDPAYEIIRQTIRKRQEHQQVFERFRCTVYTKGQIRLRAYPAKILGQKVDFEDGDTSKKKILYLAETISHYSVDKPDRSKVEVISSRVSGQSDGLGLAAPQILSLYVNNISIGSGLNPRGFISPIADKALSYYRYKLEGSFVEDGKTISRIRIIPKRKFEPLFSGYITIVEDEWVIHSTDLLLTHQSQMERLDTLRIVQQYRPLPNQTWFPASQVIYPAVKILGFDSYGSFLNVYTDVNTDPQFDKKTFNRTILKYTDSSNKKPLSYWELARPVPLMSDEVTDYHRKDSLEQVRKDPHYQDSISRKRNKITAGNLLLLGQSFQSQRKRTFTSITPLIQQVAFNPAEGWVVNPSLTWAKRLDTIPFSRRSLTIAPALRYGFSNQHFNAYLSLTYNYGHRSASAISFSGGRKVFQFNNSSPIGERGNTISCLFSEENRIKSYEAWFFRGSFKQTLDNGFSWVAAFQYQDRSPLNNTTNYSWVDRKNRSYTPNYPNEILSANIQRHQALVVLAGLRWQPGTRIVELPDRKISIPSKYPVFSVQAISGIGHLLGSDERFSKWRFNFSDNINLKLRGLLRYRIGLGGFFNSSKVQLPDYEHFNGNISTLATEYLNSFQLLPIYQFSNTAPFHVLAHVEYNLKGFLTNKIPVFRKLNYYLVTGANGFYINGNTNYYEWFIGLDNILKQLRIDFVRSYQQGHYWQNGFRIGFSKFSGQRTDDWP